MSRALSGLVIAGGDDTPLGPFLACLPEARGGTDVVITRGKVAESARSPLYFLGIVQVYAVTDGYVIEGRSARAHVDDAAKQVTFEGDLDARFSEGLAHAALLLALRLRGRYELHAAAVRAPDASAILVVGDAGAGKTTTLLTLAEAGFPWLGDDRVLLRDGRIDGYPRAMHLGEATLSMFPALAEHAAPPDGPGEKRRVPPLSSGFVADASAASVLVLPRVDPSAPTHVVPATRADAFGALVEAAAIALVDGVPGRDEHLALLRSIEASARPFSLCLGPDARTDPSVVVHALRTAGALP